jgi:protein tyrosine phosphatase (PTP) superfamily phosphohydrolase (DUF442 family)
VELPFPNSYWVCPGLLLVGEYPGSHEDEKARTRVRALARCGICYIIDLTERHEALNPYNQMLCEREAAFTHEICREQIPIPDMGTPTADTMRQILDAIDRSITEERPVYVHCRGGIGRTGTVIGCYLRRCGLKGEEALRRLAELCWCESPETPEQRGMVRNWCEPHCAEPCHPGL